jgi:crotonobetainyl-CoA:carnitine CoA-transferase CaiB-like acyl-CoA transferase
VDLGLSWAGPFAGMMLADLGADVIKIESHHHIDILRWSGAFVDGLRDFERSGYYLACNRGKRSVTLNLKTERGRELLLDLIERADVIIENFAPRVMSGLGLAPDVLLARQPDLVILSLSGYGATGPDAGRVAYGDHLLHESGLAAVTGHPDDPPTKIATFYGDPVAGLYVP